MIKFENASTVLSDFGIYQKEVQNPNFKYSDFFPVLDYSDFVLEYEDVKTERGDVIRVAIFDENGNCIFVLNKSENFNYSVDRTLFEPQTERVSERLRMSTFCQKNFEQNKTKILKTPFDEEIKVRYFENNFWIL